MKHYKRLLLSKLVDNGWELEEINSDTDWWVEEFWVIKSTRNKRGYELTIFFLVDPQFAGTDKSKAVWAVSAATEMKYDRVSAENGVALMDLVRGKFDTRLSAFVDMLNIHTAQGRE